MGMYKKMKERAIKGTNTNLSSKIIKKISRGDLEELNLSMQTIGEQNKKEREEMGITMYANGDIYSSIDVSFEDRYKKLLEGIDEPPQPAKSRVLKK